MWGREVLLYLTGSPVKAVGQELQLSDSTDLRGHLDHSDKLLALQTPQMDQVGTTTCSKTLSITAKRKKNQYWISFRTCLPEFL